MLGASNQGPAWYARRKGKLYVDLCRCDAAWLVGVHRARITTVARALLEHGELSGAQIDALL